MAIKGGIPMSGKFKCSEPKCKGTNVVLVNGTSYCEKHNMKVNHPKDYKVYVDSRKDQLAGTLSEKLDKRKAEVNTTVHRTVRRHLAGEPTPPMVRKTQCVRDLPEPKQPDITKDKDQGRILKGRTLPRAKGADVEFVDQ